MATERIEHGRDPAAPDERHDDIDPVGRVDLREHLVAHAWLARRVGQEGRVEERDERCRDRLRPTVG